MGGTRELTLGRSAVSMDAEIGHNPRAVHFAHKALVQKDLQFAADRLSRKAGEPCELNSGNRRKGQHHPARIPNIAEIDAGQQKPRRDIDPVDTLKPVKALKYDGSSLGGKGWEGRGRRNSHNCFIFDQ